MSTAVSTRTVCCKLRVDSASDVRLRATQAAFNAAASWCASVAWEQGSTNKNTLHHHVYYQTRTQFGLGAQLAWCARDKAAEAVRASRQHRRATCPTVRPDSSIRYDVHTYRLMERDQVSLNTIHGRVVGQVTLGDVQRQDLDDVTWQIGGAEVIRRHTTWYLCVTQSKRAPDPDAPLGVIGIDLGIVNLATTDDGETWSGAQVARVRERYHRRRQALQAVGTTSAKRRLKRTSGRERRFQKHVNHVISKQLVAKAAHQGKALAIEALTGIRQRATVRGPQQRRRHSGWAFGQLRTFLHNKAQRAGVVVVVVAARHTSQACNVCGHVDRRNRQTQACFRCSACGHSAAADHNAACTIRDRATVGYPHAGGPMVSALQG